MSQEYKGAVATTALQYKIGRAVSQWPPAVELTDGEREEIRALMSDRSKKSSVTRKKKLEEAAAAEARITRLEALLEVALSRTLTQPAPVQATQPAPAAVQAPLPLPTPQEPAQAPVDPWAKEHALVGSIWISESTHHPDQRDRVVCLDSFDTETGRYAVRAFGGKSKGVSYATLYGSGQGYYLLRLAHEQFFKYPKDHTR
jgi:hypothetical protein